MSNGAIHMNRRTSTHIHALAHMAKYMEISGAAFRDTTVRFNAKFLVIYLLVHYQPSTTTNCILIYPKSKYNVAEQVENNIYAYFYLDLCSIYNI